MSPLRLGAKDFTARINTFCVRSLVRQEREDAEKLRAIDRLIVRRLEVLGYKAVGPESTERTLSEVQKRIGGCIDPLSGRTDGPRCKVISPQWWTQLATELGCQAVVDPQITAVMVGWDGGRAEWDGAEEELNGGGDMKGTVGGLSLTVTIRDPNGQELYFGTGGIQVLSKFAGWGTVARVDSSQILTDEGRNIHAVIAALEGLPAPQAK